MGSENVASPAGPTTAKAPQPPRGPRGGRRWRTGLLAVACTLLSAGVTVGVVQIFFPARVPVALQGKWIVVEGDELHGATLEFFRDGTMFGTSRVDGKDVRITARVRLNGNQFLVITAGQIARSEVTDTHEVLELTARRFVVQDARGEVLVMERDRETGAARGK